MANKAIHNKAGKQTEQREDMNAEGVRTSIAYVQRADQQWVAEFRFVLVSLGRASTMPLTEASARFPTKAAAVADAAARMAATALVTTAGAELTPAQRKAVDALMAWAKSLALSAPSANGTATGARFLDCFAGVGGFHVALSTQGAVCAGAIELNQAARATYRANHPGDYPIHGDIRTAVAAMFGPVDILCGGFPCQSFSLAGDGKGLDDPAKGALFFEVARLIGELSPTVALLENVPALVGHDGGRTFDTVLDSLTRLGYAVTTALLNAADFGLPIRFACGQHGDGRIYLGVGKIYQGFWNNKRSTDYHVAQAPTTRESTSRGRAFKWSNALIARAREQHAAAIVKAFEQLGQPAEVAQKLTAQHSERIDEHLREWSQSTCSGSDLRRVLSQILPELFRLYEARELWRIELAPSGCGMTHAVSKARAAPRLYALSSVPLIHEDPALIAQRLLDGD